jgi:hypothetical protein
MLRADPYGARITPAPPAECYRTKIRRARHAAATNWFPPASPLPKPHPPLSPLRESGSRWGGGLQRGAPIGGLYGAGVVLRGPPPRSYPRTAALRVAAATMPLNQPPIPRVCGGRGPPTPGVAHSARAPASAEGSHRTVLILRKRSAYGTSCPSPPFGLSAPQGARPLENIAVCLRARGRSFSRKGVAPPCPR